MVRIGLLTLLVVFSANLFAQKKDVVTVCGEYTYRAPENVSLEQAKKMALEQAKIAALAEKFGTTIAQWNSTIVKNENGASDISFLSLGGSEVKGEWLENIKIEYGKPYIEQNMTIISVSVCGKAREIKNAGIDFLAKILNDTESKHETDNFHNGENIFLSFRSPVDGYLAVYLVDDQTVFCMLPYPKDPTGKVKIKAGKDYIFFSEKHAEPAEKQIIEKYILTAEKSVENNLLYIIFSPNEFTKANDTPTGAANPNGRKIRGLSYEDFQQWLTKNKQRDKDMKVVNKNLTIKK